MKDALFVAGCILLSVIVMATDAQAVPNRIAYQGLLNSQSGTPINGTVTATFALYDAETGGAELWMETQSILVSNGIFNVNLGADTPLPPSVFLEEVLWLGIKIGADQEMTPRQEITSSAYTQTAGQLSHEIQGEEIAREAVWPVHAGRNNTIRSYFANFSTQTISFSMPVDKDFIITDVSYHCIGGSGADWASCGIQYRLGGNTTVLYKGLVRDQTDRYPSSHESFRAGLPVPAGATLDIFPVDSDQFSAKTCTVAGFEIPASQ